MNFKILRRRHPECLETLLLLTLIILLNNCAPLYRISPEKPLSDQRTKEIIEGIKAQEGMVRSFFSIGTVSAKQWYGESEANILIAGTKNPLKIKIEISHAWGRPILHLLIDRKRLEVLSFAEKRLYLGPFTPGSLSKFLPGDLDADLIWGALRGYPNILKYHRSISPKENQVALLDERGSEIELIDVILEGPWPKQVFFPNRQIRLTFSEFQEESGITYAREVRVNHTGAKQKLSFRKKKIVFNKPIPKEIFKLEKPLAFETYYLNERPQ